MIRVMSFNIRTAEANDGDNHWQHRKQFALERIRAFAPDLLGLQECHDELQAGFIRAGLPDHAFYGVHRRAGEYNGQEMAPLLVARGVFNLEETGCFWLSETPQVVGSLSWNSAYPRTVSWARLTCRQTGRPLLFVNTHFDYEPEAIIGDARCLHHWLGGLDVDLPLILTGDFNTDKESEAYRFLTGDGRLRDAFRQVHPPGEDETTFHAYGHEEELAAIDWILVSPHFQVQEAAIDRSRQAHLFPSDHYPLSAVLDW